MTNTEITYAISFIRRDANGEHFVEYPLNLLEGFEDLTMDSPLSEFIKRWQDSIDTMVEADSLGDK